MPTIFSHPAVALGLFPWFRGIVKSPLLLALAAVLTILPDLDVVGFYLGTPYNHLLGHRGLSHSLPFALVVSVGLAAWLGVRYQVSRIALGLFFFLSMASHGLLDALTSGGLGIAFFSPFSNERFFFDMQPIAVSPLGITRFMSDRGLVVILSELQWVWLPMLGLAALGLAYTFFRRYSKEGGVL